MNFSSNPTMFDTRVQFAGIELQVDPINRKRTEDSDNVMAIFYEEQPFTWEFSKPYISQAIKESKGNIDFLDIGCGSGVFSLLFAKHFPGSKIIALDKSSRAIQQTIENAKRNEVEFEVKHESYSINDFPYKSAKIIGINPPFHLYPEEITESIPQHARGGSNGQEEFKNQLAIADHHLAENGIMFIIQMCLGNNDGPAFLDYIPKLVGGNPSIIYTNVFPRIDTREFLEGVYSNQHQDYIEKTCLDTPWCYYCVIIIRRDGKGEIQEVKHDINLEGRSWKDRIQLHWEIALHEYK